MLLYPLHIPSARTWLLDLTAPQTALDLPSVYALVVPLSPPLIYIGATRDLTARVRRHLSRARRAWGLAALGARPGTPTTAAAGLRPVITGRAGLLVIRLEAAPPDDRQALQRLELCWLLVAAREELPVKRQRGPRLQWDGEPGELRAAFRLARSRHWPDQWIRALRPLCQNHVLPQPPGRKAPAGAPDLSPCATARHHGAAGGVDGDGAPTTHATPPARHRGPKPKARGHRSSAGGRR
jgi:hypothetical protein